MSSPALHPEEFRALLREVSRSFDKTLSILPRGVRKPIGLAYLLARATDTVADTEAIPIDQRLDTLQILRHRIAGDTQESPSLAPLSSHQTTPGEARLLDRLPSLFAELDQLSPGDQAQVRQVAQTITSGQELDLRRFRNAHAKAIVALNNAEELDDYTYRVAGCVGEFWTNLCTTHLFQVAPERLAQLRQDGVRFGKGLQLVNILRDLPVDLRAGRCYLPEVELAQSHLKPADLLDTSQEERLRPIYQHWLHQARDHLLTGWQYTNALPWRCFRLRLACAWPILIGLETLEKLRREQILDPGHRIKITRQQLRRIIIRSTLALPWPGPWRSLVVKS